MKTNNPVLDNLVETQTQFLNNWMDSAKKVQAAFTTGTMAGEGQNLYKEFFDKQMSLLNNMQQSASGMFGNTNNDPQEFFRNWFNQQAGYAKQMADFTQSIQNSFANFGKPAQDYMSGFGQTNTAFSNIYNSWLNTLNTSYDAMSRNMNGAFNKNVFANFMQGNQVYAKMQEFFQPMADAMQKGQFNFEAYKKHFTAENYSALAKQMFGTLYNDNSVSEVYNNGLKQLQQFFTVQNNLGKEYFAQMQSMKDNFPQLFNTGTAANLKDLYTQMQDVFGKTFEPLMKLVSPGKEKENAEAVIALMDKMAQYSIRQAELQAQLQETAKKGVEKIAEKYAAKMSDPKTLTEVPNAEEMYKEWVKVNEELFTELFASDEFSKIKGDTINLGMDVKKHFESQFESMFQNYPIVFKSEVEEMQKTIHELRKQVKDLQQKAGVNNEAEEDKQGKNRKK